MITTYYGTTWEIRRHGDANAARKGLPRVREGIFNDEPHEKVLLHGLHETRTGRKKARASAGGKSVRNLRASFYAAA